MSTWTDVRAWLDSRIEAPVGVAVPEQRPPAFVVACKTGGEYNPPFDRPQITFEAWAGSMAEADALLQQVKDLLDAHPTDVRWHCDPVPDATDVFIETYDGTHFGTEITYQFAALC